MTDLVGDNDMGMGGKSPTGQNELGIWACESYIEEDMVKKREKVLNRPPALKRPVWKDAKGLETPKPAAGKKVHKKQHGLRGSALIHAAERLESKKAEYVAHTTLSEVVGSFTMREKEIIAMVLHEVGTVLRASGSTERHLR